MTNDQKMLKIRNELAKKHNELFNRKRKEMIYGYTKMVEITAQMDAYKYAVDMMDGMLYKGKSNGRAGASGTFAIFKEGNEDD